MTLSSYFSCRYLHAGRDTDRSHQDLRKSLDTLHTRYKPGAFNQTVDELKYDDVINKMIARTFISDNDVKFPVQACARDGGIMAISCDPNTQTSHIPVQEGAVGGYDEGNRGFCRPEMSSPLPCSYDENNPEEGLNEPRVAACPRGELGSDANTQDDETTLLKTVCVKESTL